MATARAALLGGDERQVHRIRHEVGGEQEALLLALGREIVRLAVEARLEIVLRVEDEIRVAKHVEHGGQEGDADIARALLARAIEVLMPAVHGNGEDGAGLPFEGHACAGIVPHGGRAAAVEDEDHLFIELALQGELAASVDLADVAIVRGARCVVVDIDALAAAASPGLHFDGAQVRHILCADDIEPLFTDELQIGRVLLRGEFLRQIIPDDCVLCHSTSPRVGSAHCAVATAFS